MQYQYPQQDFEVYQTYEPDEARVRAGLQRFMLRVYGYMTFALILTTAVAVTAYTMAVDQVTPDGTIYLTDFGNTIYNSWLRWVILLAPLGAVIFMSVKAWSMAPNTARMMLWIFAGLMGLSLSSIFLIYPNQVIFQVAGIAAAMFGAMSLYGYTTKRDLSGIGSFLIMALIGLILSSIVNMFIGSGTFSLIISVVGILIFCGLTAYDTNRVKNQFPHVMADESASTRLAVNGALSLYLSYINLFLLLLSLMGGRR